MTLRTVTFQWDDSHGLCYDCGRPAAFESNEHSFPPESLRCAVCAANDAASGAMIWRIDEGIPKRKGVGRPSLNGVYCVYLDANIVGVAEPVAWTFADEVDADEMVSKLDAIEGEGMSWKTWEPIAYSHDDPDLISYLEGRQA